MTNSQYTQPINNLEKYRNSNNIIHKDGEEKLRNSISPEKEDKWKQNNSEFFYNKYEPPQKLREEEENRDKNFSDKKSSTSTRYLNKSSSSINKDHNISKDEENVYVCKIDYLN